jgi:excisionase family DNA binding protein
MRNRTKLKPMLTVTDVSNVLNISVKTVRRWTNRGILTTYRIGPRGDRRFRQSDIVKFLNEESKSYN